MKRILRSTLLVLVAITVLFSLASCLVPIDADAVWADAVYTEDTAFGSGAVTVEVEVVVEEKSVTFTISTDAATLGDALLEHGLIAGENGAYGLYVKTVNGILADYDVDCSYWAFYKGGEYLMAGVDAEYVTNGAHYEIVYTK